VGREQLLGEPPAGSDVAELRRGRRARADEPALAVEHDGGLAAAGEQPARPLDRSRPLWEIYLITGLAKRRAAVYTKIHHSAIDGVSGAELLTVLLDLQPEGRELPPAEPFAPASLPGQAALAALAAARLVWRPVQTVRVTNEIIRVMPTLAPVLSGFVGAMLGLNRGDGEMTVLGVFRPAGSPAEAYYPDGSPARVPGGLLALVNQAQHWALPVFAVMVYLLTALTGLTLGKRLLGIRVARLDGKPVGFGWALVRTLLLLVVIPALFSDRDQRGLHDRAANTVVIRA